MVKTYTQALKPLLYGLLSLTAVISIGIPFFRSYPLELFCNFRVYYLLLAIGIAIAFLLYHLKGGRVRLGLYLALALVAFNSIWILPWYLLHTQQGKGDTVRVLAFNINIANGEWDAIANAVGTVKPDIAAIIETSALATEKLSARLTPQLPFVYRTSGGGLTLFSRFPLISPQSKTFENGTILQTSVQLHQKVVQVVVTHPTVPIKPAWFRRRNAFLAELTAFLRSQTQAPLIVLGDFNLTPWSPYYTHLIEQTGLHNTRFGFGIEPSWIEAASYVHHSRWITTLVKIPIDHILVSSGIKVADCKTAKAANSDHRMLWSDLVL